jgi:hypothetical protein
MRKLAWQVEQTAIAAHRQRKRMKQENANTTSLQLQEIMPVQLPMPEEKMPVQLPLPEEKMPVQLPEEKMPVQLPSHKEKFTSEEKMPVPLLNQSEKKNKKNKKRKMIDAEDDLLSSDLVSPVDKEWV